MSDRIGNLIARIQQPVAIAMVVLPMMAMSDLAWAQATPQPAPSPQGPPAQSAPQRSEPAPKENSGLINEIGKLLEKPAALLPTLKGPKETIDDAAGALSRLTTSPGVRGRAACPVAANGAPDCKAAADKLCQSKGFKEGKSLDVDTARNCSAKALLSGRKPEESECRTETYVTRAVCQ
ncbi:hypothetical protein [Bradyrhizobium sp.]|jgi:hypothetical protein|uniref:hypothetical protein n=1 Tax=Bradyrhizobium sp. TaxID=376 RepID=UPI002E01331D|nr:hypothetical protein [Bradyrhizobium sp.]